MTPEERLAALENMLKDATWVASMIIPTESGKIQLTTVSFTDEKFGRLARFKKEVGELNANK